MLHLSVCHCGLMRRSHFLFQTYRHELFFDKDTIVHVEQKNTAFCCHVYKLNTTTT